VVTTGLSKNLALGGWRQGVARLPDTPTGRQLRTQVIAIASEIWSSPTVPVQHAAAWAFGEPQQARDRISESRRVHAAVARAVSHALANAGVDHPPPTGGFYLYPDFGCHRQHLAERWSVHTAAQLAALLLERHGIATLPASAFGGSDHTLALRLATSGLYGDTDQRHAALRHPDPSTLPWIDAHLRKLSGALAELLPTIHRATDAPPHKGVKP